ncbi:hypothetical protein [Nonomuraea sp. NPDC049400]|uniref:hypothetical protein n=1 Tax=Nonomuraea sp. NPDC049400 TaxID=3364352 RepID=UPI0037A26E12
MANSSHEELESGSRTASQALADYVAEWSRQTGITVEIWALPKQPLPTAITEIVHGTIRDVLQEVERQAATRTVAIALTVAPSGLRLTVSHDDSGMSADVLETRLRSRRAEIAGLGGRLTVNGVRGEGTTISAAVPLGKASPSPS